MEKNVADYERVISLAAGGALAAAGLRRRRAAGIGMAALGMAAVAEAGPRDAVQAAGVFPPWWSQAGVLAAAGEAGQVTAMGALPFIVVIRSSEGAAGPRLRAAGALLTLKPGLAGSCGS